MLLIAQISPPSEIVAARRTAGLAKYLARLGHPVTVLSSCRSGDGEVEGAATVKTRDLVTTRLNFVAARSHSHMHEPPTGSLGGISAHIVPDIAMLTWLPFALPRAVTLGRQHHFDCVVTSSPPPSIHMLGPVFRRFGSRWIADFRDGWTFDPPRPAWPFRFERRLDARLETALMRRSDAAIGVTEPIVEDLSERLGRPARLVSNGFDPDERRSVDPSAAEALLSPNRHSLVHTGRAGVSGRSPRIVLDGLRLLADRAPGLAERFEVVFAGPVSPEEQKLFADPRLAGLARTVGMIPRRMTLALQQAADSLLVIASGSSERSVATGKLYEYLTAGPPILVVGDLSQAAKVVAETGTGISVASDSPAAVASGIEKLIEGTPTKRNSTAIARYSWENLAAQASEWIEEICGSSPDRCRPGAR